jgi:hypothetical protein
MSDCIFDSFYYFISLQLERRDQVASQTLRNALAKAEQTHPGLTYDLIMGIIRKGEINVNMNESLLRLQGAATDTDCKYNPTGHVHAMLFLKFIQFFNSDRISFESHRRRFPGIE